MPPIRPPSLSLSQRIEATYIAATQEWLDKVTSMYTMARLSGWHDKGAGAVVLQKLNGGVSEISNQRRTAANTV